MHKQGVSLAEAAKRLGMSQSDFYAAVQRGRIPAFTRNGRTLVRPGALREYQMRERPQSDYKL